MNLDRNYALDAESIASALQKPKRAGLGKYVACCPAHDDKTPSLSIQDASDRVLVHCHAGCSQEEVIDRLRDLGLWHKPSPKRIAFQKSKSLTDEIRFNQILLALATQEAQEGVVHSEFERARIRRAIHFLEEHGNG